MRSHIFITCGVLSALLFAPTPGVAATGATLVDVQKAEPRVALDMRYATTDNFAHTALYPVVRCLLRPEVAAMVSQAQTNLQRAAPGYTLLMKDCYRPVSVQRHLFDVVKGTPAQGYVADPNNGTGSVHTYGAAVDLTLRDADGHEVDMGTPYDFLGALAQPRFEARFRKSGQLSVAQLKARLLLRNAMTAAGFRTIRNEWWHFDAWQGQALRARYEPLDVPL